MKTTTYTFNPEMEMMNSKSNLKWWKTVAAIASAGLMGASIFSAKAAPAGMKTLHGHVPAVVSHLQAVGDLPAETNLTLAIGLPLHHTDELKKLLNDVYDSSSTNYHHFLTPEQFTEKFGPTEQDYQMVANFADVNHLSIKATHPNRMLLDVTGKAADIEKAFNIKLRVYQHPTKNRRFFAPDREPSVNSGLPILDISGLSDFGTPTPRLVARPLNTITNKTKIGSGPVGLYMGDDFRNAYIPASTLRGSGQTVGLFQADGYSLSDILQYESMTGRTNIPLQNVLIDGASGAPSGFGGEVEVSLDIEMAISMAPALSKIILYEGNLFDFIPNDILNRIATDDAASQIGCSWGWSGGPSGTTDQIFQQMALQGQTFFDASGDSDAFTTGANSVNGVDNPSIPNVPSDDPYITQVGGTTLTMNGQGISYSSEVVWNWGTEFGIDGVGSSGGISSYYSIPSWQTNINMPARGGDQTMRNTPDVAGVADNVFVIADGGAEYSVGGTSCAAPLWAGYMALVNQQAALNGHAVIGFINPAIYAIANSVNYTNCFHDIVFGNNEWSQSPNLFVAANNYDLCTGLGTPNGINLINALAGVNNGIAHLSPPPPPYGATLTGLNGQNPNGNWQLFVLDNANFNAGIISNGWVLKLTTATPVGFSADLALGMTASANTISISNTVIYTLTVTNYGPSASSNILVADTLPLAGAVVSTSADQGAVTRNGQTLNWSVGNLSTNTGSKMLLTLQLNSAGNIINFADVNATTPDANADDDFADATVTVVNPNPPQFSSVVAQTNGTFQLTVTTPALPTIIQASTNLINWVSIYTNTPPFTFTDSNAASYPHRFYRAVTP